MSSFSQYSPPSLFCFKRLVGALKTDYEECSIKQRLRLDGSGQAACLATFYRDYATHAIEKNYSMGDDGLIDFDSNFQAKAWKQHGTQWGVFARSSRRITMSRTVQIRVAARVEE